MAEVIQLSSDEESCASNSKPEQLTTMLDDWNKPSTSSASHYTQPPSPEKEDTLLSPLMAFQQVIDACKMEISSGDVKGRRILTQLQKQYDRIDTDSKNTETFKEFLANVKSQISSNPKRIYIFIKDLNDEMKLIMHTPSKQNNCDNSRTNSIPSKENNTEGKETKTSYKIKQLEKLLSLLSKKIQKLEEKELGYDDLNNDSSNYLMEDRYKRRFIKVWKKLCELNKSPELTGRWTERTFSYKGSRCQEVNKKVTKYINKYKELPEFADILELITKVNKDYNLLLNVDVEARRVFTEVVDILRQRRILDFEEGFMIPNDQPDPAEENRELADSLEESRQLGIQRINQVLDDFAVKQCNNETEQSTNEESNDAQLNGAVKVKEEYVKGAEVKENEKKTSGGSGEEDEDAEDDDEENETDNLDLGQITEEFQDELETEGTTEENTIIDSETSEDEDSSEENNTEQHNNASSPDDLPSCLEEPVPSKPISILKRPFNSMVDDSPSPKRLHLAQSMFAGDDDVIVLD
uniref:Daxx histone-binding domain-containing protein n=1 Tax=Strigamia maritima TaxID=126957 RepID=T1J7R2_STRMM